MSVQEIRFEDLEKLFVQTYNAIPYERVYYSLKQYHVSNVRLLTVGYTKILIALDQLHIPIGTASYMWGRDNLQSLYPSCRLSTANLFLHRMGDLRVLILKKGGADKKMLVWGLNPAFRNLIIPQTKEEETP